MFDRNATLDQGRNANTLLDEFVAGQIIERLSGIHHGKLRVTLPSGKRFDIGPGGGTDAVLKINSYGVFWRALGRGMIGFANSYMAEEIETPELAAVMRFFLTNFSHFDSAGGGWFRTRLMDRLGHRRHVNTRAGSRRNIAAHYDLGNAFYALWLDTDMTYSSGLFEDEGQSLEQAQEAKQRLILDALDIAPGQRVLEMGCGWGSLAEQIARQGAAVTAITVSAEQHRYATARVAEAGLQDRAEVRLEDYRDVTGTFDRVVSVEMIEAVGAENWPLFFGKLHDRLAPGGTALLQAITISDESFETYRQNPDFIQRYIFPGGMLPTVAIMDEQARANGLRFEIVRRFGESYAETLRLWRSRFLDAWPQIAALGFDERFRRMWNYYLTYCEVGFETGLIDVGVYRISRVRE